MEEFPEGEDKRKKMKKKKKKKGKKERSDMHYYPLIFKMILSDIIEMTSKSKSAHCIT